MKTKISTPDIPKFMFPHPFVGLLAAAILSLPGSVNAESKNAEPLSGSQPARVQANLTSVQSGNWSNPATWGGSVPTNADNVTIANGHTVTIDSSNALTVTVQSGGILQFEATTARTLTVGQSVIIDSGGTFQSNPSGTQTGHVLSVGTNLTNNGTLDFSTNGNTAGASITFTGAANNTFDGTGGTTDVRTLTVNKGTTNANILELNPTNFTVQGGTVDAASMAFLTLTNGTLKVSGTFTMTGRIFTSAAYSIGTTAGFWLNNPNFTIAAQNGSPAVSGLLRISQGTFNIGTASGNSMGFNAGSTIIIEGGAVNAAGRFGVAAAANTFTYNQSGGTITVDTLGNTSITLASFDLGTSLTSTIIISGGSVIVQLANTGVSGPRDYRHQAGNGITGVTGATLQLGNASSGAAKAFGIAGVVPNLVISNASAGHSATFLAPAGYNNISLNITLNPGTTLDLGNNIFLFDGTTLTNNGTLTHTGASSRFTWFRANTANIYTGSGTVTAPMTSFEVLDDLGVTIDPVSPNIVVARIILYAGGITNANKLTLGNGGATTGTVLIGSPTTPLAAGTLDVAPTFNLGTGGQVVSYYRTTASRTTGPEINPTRVLASMTYDDNDVTHSLSIAGGDLTLSNSVGALTLTNGRIITGANTLALSSGTGGVFRTNGYVDGNLRKTFAAIANKTFEVGTANAYSPVAVNVTAGTFPANFTAKAIQGQAPYVSGTNALARYWTLTGAGITANLTFTYLASDVTGTVANYKFVKSTAGALSILAPTGTPTSTSAVINGVSSFSDWTLAEASAVQFGTLQFSAANFNDNETNVNHNATITVTRTGGSDGAVSVHYATSDGTATLAGNDYLAASGNLAWASGDAASKSFNVPINGDVTNEPDETVNLTLSAAAGGAALGSPNPSTLTILNDDSGGSVAVTNTNDSGAGSLRQALATASDGDTITFNIPRPASNGPAVTDVITLTSGELVIDKNVTISGPGADVLAVERDTGAGAFRIFHITSGHTVTIQGLTISSGLAQGPFPANGGGGIYSDHSVLTVTRCALNGNSADYGGGIFNDGSVTGSASVTVISSTLDENDATSSGGGIYNHGESGGSAGVTVNNTTFSANAADAIGGAIINDGDGGAATLDICNSTLSANSSPGGGGLQNTAGVITIGNTVLKSGAQGANLVNGGGSITSAGYNLSNDNGGGFLTSTGDQINTDPMLGPLKNNGGTTLTHAPLINSPAIDQGRRNAIPALTTNFDQRGLARPVNDPAVANAGGGDASDIGAVELAIGVHPTGAVSNKNHTGVGDFPIDLPLTGPVGVECRRGAVSGEYQIIVTFAGAATFSSASVNTGAGSVGSSSGSGSNQATINLTGVTNAQIITVALFDVNDNTNSGDLGIRMGMLLGDVNGVASVTVSDVNVCRSRVGSLLSPTNFRSDVNTTGAVTVSDVNLVRGQVGASLP